MSINTTHYLPEEQLVQRALEALMATLGPVEATRFLTLVREDRIESVERHRRWQTTLDRDTFFHQVFRENKPAP